jgi:hypothetical protein
MYNPNMAGRIKPIATLDLKVIFPDTFFLEWPDL